MTEVEKLASFVASTRFEDLSNEILGHLKIRILDSLGVAIGALDADLIHVIRNQTQEFGGNPLVTLIGSGKSAPRSGRFLQWCTSSLFRFYG